MNHEHEWVVYSTAIRVGPTDEQARFLQKKEWYGGSLDGLAMQMPNVVDWSRSEVDLSPLIPWLRNPDMMWPRKLERMLERKWPELRGQLEVIRLEVEIIGDGYKWGNARFGLSEHFHARCEMVSCRPDYAQKLATHRCRYGFSALL